MSVVLPPEAVTLKADSVPGTPPTLETEGSTPLPAPTLFHTAKRETREFVKTVAFALVIAFVVRTFLYQPFNIPSGSMIPNLLVGDYLFVNKFAYGYSNLATFMGFLPFKGRLFGAPPQRGDIIVFKLPSDTSTDYIKRLIGVPGDRVQMREGRLYINDQEIPRELQAVTPPLSPLWGGRATETYVETLPNGVRHLIQEEGDDRPLDSTPVFEVPPGHYFFMGDNRDNSRDSRTDLVGFVPAENLVGRASFLFFSLHDGTHAWEFWTWPWTIRWDRLAKTVT